jgi:DNA-binding XRE family transcriptional regulator
MTNLERIQKQLSPARRHKILGRTPQLIGEEMTLQQLRRDLKLTQVHMAKELGISQDGISKLEKRNDLLLSTLRKTVEAMGGNLSLIAEFPDRDPVVLSGIAQAGAQTFPRPTRERERTATPRTARRKNPWAHPSPARA